jgi:Zn-dependent peptidase ImmA (M78 family)/transcriptional regulator with XRE-family HTH domain
MLKQFNPARLNLARVRNQLTLKALAEKVGLTSRMVSEYEKEYCKSIPRKDTIDAFAKALGYPVGFFFIEKSIETIDPESVSFRSLKSMKASQQHAAIGAGRLGLMLDDYLSSRFNLPAVSLPNFRSSDPEAAAEALREEWGIGSHCITNMVHLLEKHGIRVFSLAENTSSVDAFSFWKDGRPFVFLNTQKSGERSRMDAAHELGHLILHKHGIPQGKDIEAEADKFASFFLMPRRTVLARASKYLMLEDVLNLRPLWKTSAMSIIMQLRAVGVITEWHHRTLLIEASKLGLRSKEINGIESEKSRLLELLLKSLREDNISLKNIAEDLMLPLQEITNLVFQLGVIKSDKNIIEVSERRKPTLSVVK